MKLVLDPQPLAIPICRDPDDDQILATALSGKCHVIISGDKDLTDLGRVEGIDIVTPSGFWKFEAEALSP